jgi:hypothetical protein
MFHMGLMCSSDFPDLMAIMDNIVARLKKDYSERLARASVLSMSYAGFCNW